MSTEYMEVNMGLAFPNDELDMTMDFEGNVQNEPIDWAASLPPTPRNTIDDELDDPNAFDLDVLDRMQSYLRHPDPEPPTSGRRPFQDEEDHWRERLTELENKYGTDPETLIAMRELVNVLVKLGRYLTLESFLCRLALASQKAFGNEHLVTLNAFQHLATCFGFQGRNLTAEKVLRQILKFRTKELGADHLATFDAKFLLGVCLLNQSKYEEASGVFGDVLERNQKAHGFDHPITLRATNGLLKSFAFQGTKPGNFLAVGSQLYRTLQRVLGPEDVDTLEAAKTLSFALCENCQPRNPCRNPRTIKDFTR